jgi:hypothetical protein
MIESPVYDEPSEVAVEDGAVVVKARTQSISG